MSTLVAPVLARTRATKSLSSSALDSIFVRPPKTFRNWAGAWSVVP